MGVTGDPGGGGNEQWPTDLPEFCKGVEVYKEEPFYSMGDGVGKALLIHRLSSQQGTLESVGNHDSVKASLFWADRAIEFYKEKPALVNGIVAEKAALQKLETYMAEKKYDEVPTTIKELADAHKDTERTFQIETGKLVAKTATALYPLMRAGMNPAVLNELTKVHPKETIVSLLQLIDDHKEGKMDDEGLKNAVQKLFKIE